MSNVKTPMVTYQTFSEAIQDMRSRGFIHTLSIQQNEIVCPELDTTLAPESITIVERHLVQAPDTVAGEREVFACKTDSNHLGILTNTYAYYDPEGFAAIFSRFRQMA
ncbi:hypothetical protein [Pontibacter harenae]|uniref:hypothetical protein n=1 Tax=Pontibacter harenae TaxID=2894083 RepID=UPI001E4B9EB3|nr:hypothetical protein [Pontibacter harenae]MCC9166402.1 hypothetical protein [Pontibacter harenae]